MSLYVLSLPSDKFPPVKGWLMCKEYIGFAVKQVPSGTVKIVLSTDKKIKNVISSLYYNVPSVKGLVTVKAWLDAELMYDHVLGHTSPVDRPLVKWFTSCYHSVRLLSLIACHKHDTPVNVDDSSESDCNE